MKMFDSVRLESSVLAALIRDRKYTRISPPHAQGSKKQRQRSSVCGLKRQGAARSACMSCFSDNASHSLT
jgi:hypothetical protein